MDWSYIAGFFDGEGNIQIQKTKNYKNGNHNLTIRIRIYQSSEKVLEEIQRFVGYGSIYQKKKTLVFELDILKKEDVKNFILNIKNNLIVKKEEIEYILNNYNFERNNNTNFDVDKLRSFVTRKNSDKFRKLHTQKKFA